MQARPESAFVVAITRWGCPFEQELATFAAWLGLTPYDLRLRLAGEPPVILERTTDAEHTTALLARVRERGHGAVACDVADVVSSEELPPVRGFGFEPAAVVLEHANAEPIPIANGEILALLRAVHLQVETTETRTRSRQISLGRAALTGGLSFTKKVTKQARSVHDSRQNVLYVFRGEGEGPLILRERSMRYTGLGDRLGPSAPENFATLVSMLRERMPHALFDDRLARHLRRKLDVRLSGPVGQTVATSSNVWATDLAAHLLVLAHLRDQL